MPAPPAPIPPRRPGQSWEDRKQELDVYRAYLDRYEANLRPVGQSLGIYLLVAIVLLVFGLVRVFSAAGAELPPGLSGMTAVEAVRGDKCPNCGGELDTGWECNECGRDARPLVIPNEN